MRLNETEMVKLLPAWMQEDGSDKGIATGCDIISRDAYARLKLLSRWDKTAYEPPIPYDYAVYYGKDLTPSREFT